MPRGLHDLPAYQLQDTRQQRSRLDELEHRGGRLRLRLRGAAAGWQIGAEREGAEQRGEQAQQLGARTGARRRRRAQPEQQLDGGGGQIEDGARHR